MSQWLTHPQEIFPKICWCMYCINVYKMFFKLLLFPLVFFYLFFFSNKIHEEKNKGSPHLTAYNATVLPYISNEKSYSFWNYILPPFPSSYSNYIFPFLLSHPNLSTFLPDETCHFKWIPSSKIWKFFLVWKAQKYIWTSKSDCHSRYSETEKQNVLSLTQMIKDFISQRI